MKFSIVITTYNRLFLLKRSLHSALTQTVPCEVVVVDDCSSDGTEAYFSNLRDFLPEELCKRVVYHRHLANLGHSAATNAGVEVAQGDWIKLLDDDDYLAPTCIEEMMRAIDSHKRIDANASTQAVICSCQAIQVDTDGAELSRTRRTGPGKTFYIPQEDIHYGMLLERVPFGTPVQVAFRRDAFLKSGGWDSSLDTNCDDIDSWVKIAQFGDAIFINKCLAYRTIWNGAQNQRFSLQKRLDTNILIKQRIYRLVNEKYRSMIPALDDIQDYLKLHWSGVALKQKKVVAALKMAFPAVFSLTAWKLLIEAVSTRRQPSETLEIRKLVLIESQLESLSQS